MKYCRECGVNVNEKHANCPLCGAYLEEEGRGQQRYAEEIENNINNYEIEYRDIIRRNFWSKRVFTWCLMIIAACFVINFLTSRDSLWSCYVAVGVLVIYFSAISSIFKRKRFYAIFSNCATYVSMALVLIDVVLSFDTVRDMSAFGFSLKFAVPALLIAVIIACDVLIGKGDKRCTYYLLTMYWASFLALVPQVVIWIAFDSWTNTWLALSAFAFAIVNGIVLTTIHGKEVTSEIKRKLNTK